MSKSYILDLSYAADTCQVLIKLNNLVAQTEGECSNDSKEEITVELTKIFSRLAAEWQV